MFHSDKVARLVGSGHSRLHPPIRVGWGQVQQEAACHRERCFFACGTSCGASVRDFARKPPLWCRSQI